MTKEKAEELLNWTEFRDLYFRDYVKEWLKERGLTQAWLAVQLHTEPSTISKVLNGHILFTHRDKESLLLAMHVYDEALPELKKVQTRLEDDKRAFIESRITQATEDEPFSFLGITRNKEPFCVRFKRDAQPECPAPVSKNQMLVMFNDIPLPFLHLADHIEDPDQGSIDAYIEELQKPDTAGVIVLGYEDVEGCLYLGTAVGKDGKTDATWLRTRDVNRKGFYKHIYGVLYITKENADDKVEENWDKEKLEDQMRIWLQHYSAYLRGLPAYSMSLYSWTPVKTELHAYDLLDTTQYTAPIMEPVKGIVEADFTRLYHLISFTVGDPRWKELKNVSYDPITDKLVKEITSKFSILQLDCPVCNKWRGIVGWHHENVDFHGTCTKCGAELRANPSYLQSN